MKKKITKQRVTEYVDSTTGEMTRSVVEDDFYVDYSEHFTKVFILKKGDVKKKRVSNCARSLFLEFITQTCYENKIYMNLQNKNVLSSELDMSIKTIERALKELVEKDYLRRCARGVYMINPYIATTGNREEVKKNRILYDELEIESKKEKSKLSNNLLFNELKKANK